ncbi:MAG TPA: inositol monophosphatase, partial [bacterium]|nr:inositol monophosphatase [bacterium]
TITALDRQINASIVDTLRRHMPHFGIISEEAEAYLPQAEWRWVLDPVDGTASFARGYPIWGLGLGLLHHDQPVEGYLRCPATNETFCAAEGRVWRNGAIVAAHPAPTLPDMRNLLVGSSLERDFPYHKVRYAKIRNFGSALYHLACLAVGRADAVVLPPAGLWDLVAGLAMTRPMGMVEVHLDGSPFDLGRLANDAVHHYREPRTLLIGKPEEVQQLLAALSA